MAVIRTLGIEQKYSGPGVSILIPVKGDAVYLSQAVESVIAQTYTDWELILILDRPGTTTKAFAEKLARTTPKVRVIESKFPGISEALNCGILNTSSPLIARLDSDDVMESVRLEKQVLLLTSSEELGCVGSQVSLIDELGGRIGMTNLPTSPKRIQALMLYQNCVAHPSVMLKRCVLETVGLYDSRFDGCEDYHLWLRLLKVKKIQNVAECLTRYRMHDFQESSKLNPLRQTLCLVALFEYYGLAVDDFFEGKVLRYTTKELRRFSSAVKAMETLLPWGDRRRITFSRHLTEGSYAKGFRKLYKFIMAFFMNPTIFLSLRRLYIFTKKNLFKRASSF